MKKINRPTPDQKRRFWNRQGRGKLICHYCKKIVNREVHHNADNRATIEHLIPLSLGGRNLMSNMVVACWPCNFQRAKQTSDNSMKQLYWTGNMVRKRNYKYRWYTPWRPRFVYVKEMKLREEQPSSFLGLNPKYAILDEMRQ